MNDDLSRQAATIPDTDFTLSIDEALQLYSSSGLPRTPRSVQRYCAKGHLQCRLIETEFGEKYLINSASVEKHIAYIREVTPATSRDGSRPAATSRVLDRDSTEGSDTLLSTSVDQSRPVATSPDLSRFVERLEGENEFLRKQISVKDDQIKDLTERARETNHLIAGLQKMLSPLLGGNTEPRQ
jgi:hypothetical protein